MREGSVEEDLQKNLEEKRLHGSTIRDLHPYDHRTLNFKRFKNHLRMHGSMMLPLKRPSRTPEHARPYAPGDPLNVIDWRAYARTDQLIVRQQQDEANAHVAIAFDLSESMFWPTPETIPHQSIKGSVPPQKAEIALRIATHLAACHLAAGDSVELEWGHTKNQSWQRSQAMSLRSSSAVTGFFNAVAVEHPSPSAMSGFFPNDLKDRERFDLFYLITDGIGLSAENLVNETSKTPGFCLMHLLSSFEMSLDWVNRELVYFDETRLNQEYIGRQLLEPGGYQEKLVRWCRLQEDSVMRAGGNYLLLTDQSPIATYEHFINQISFGG